MGTLTNGESATLSLDAFASVSVVAGSGCEGSMVWTSAMPSRIPSFTSKIQNKVYGPQGAPMTLVITVTAGSMTYLVNGTVNNAPLSVGVGVADAAANTSAIQAALTAGGLVQITTSGDYRLAHNRSLVIPSKTTLYLGPGVRLLSRDGRICPVIRNKYAANIIAGPQLVRASNVVTVTEAGHTKAVGDQVFVNAISAGTTASFIALVTVASVVEGTSWTYASTGTDGNAGASTVFYGLIPVRQTLAGTAFVATSFYVTVTEAGHDKRPGMNVWIGKEGGSDFAPGVVQVTKVTADTWTYATSAATGTGSGTHALSYDYDITIDGEGIIDGNRAGIGSIATGSECMGSTALFGNVTNLRINSRIGGSNVRGIEFKNCAYTLLDKGWAGFDCLVAAQFEGGAVRPIIDQAGPGSENWHTTTNQKVDDYVAFTGVKIGLGAYDNFVSPYGLTFFSGVDVRSINATNALNGVKITSYGAECPFRGITRIGSVYGRLLDNLPLTPPSAAVKIQDDGPGLASQVIDTLMLDGPFEWRSPVASDGVIAIGATGTIGAVFGRGFKGETNQVGTIKTTTGAIVIGLFDVDASRFGVLGTNLPGISHGGAVIRKMKVRNSTIVVGTAQPFVSFSGGVMNALEFESCMFSGETSGVGDLIDYALASAALNSISFKGCRTPTSGNGFNSACVFASGLAIPALDISFEDHDVTSASGIRCNDATSTGTVNVYLGAKVKWTATGGNNFLQVGGSGSSMTWRLFGGRNNRNSLPAAKVFLTGFGSPIYQSEGFTQVVASSATPALRCGLGNNVTFTATAASAWAEPSEIPPAGTPVTITITQDATGGRAITWGAAYIFPTAWSNTGNTANTISEANFISNGTKLVAQGANVWHA